MGNSCPLENFDGLNRVSRLNTSSPNHHGWPIIAGTPEENLSNFCTCRRTIALPPLPPLYGIAEMTKSRFDDLTQGLRVNVLARGKRHGHLDWPHLASG